MWQGIEGHDDVVDKFRRAVERGRLGGTFLFVGPAGIGKRGLADKLAQALLCPYVDAATLNPCGRCDSCVQAASGTHPDLIVVEKPPDKSFIPLSAFVGDDTRRMREGLCHDIALKPFMGGRKVVIIDDADYLNEESANALLKTLEEPPPRSVLILIGTSADRQLPTIRSRAQTIRFQPLAQDTVARILLAKGLATDAEQAARLAEFSGGSIERAVEQADEALRSFRQDLLAALAAPRFESVGLAQTLVAFVDAAGKEAGPRRMRARQVISFAAEFYRQLVRAASGVEPQGDAGMVQVVSKVSPAWTQDADVAAACVERSLEALWQVDRNAHQATLLECWLDDLSRIVETGQPVPNYADY